MKPMPNQNSLPFPGEEPPKTPVDGASPDTAPVTPAAAEAAPVDAEPAAIVPGPRAPQGRRPWWARLPGRVVVPRRSL